MFCNLVVEVLVGGGWIAWDRVPMIDSQLVGHERQCWLWHLLSVRGVGHWAVVAVEFDVVADVRTHVLPGSDHDAAYREARL